MLNLIQTKVRIRPKTGLFACVVRSTSSLEHLLHLAATSLTLVTLHFHTLSVWEFKLIILVIVHLIGTLCSLKRRAYSLSGVNRVNSAVTDESNRISVDIKGCTCKCGGGCRF